MPSKIPPIEQWYDAAARRYARTLNIATLGTGGMLVLVKCQGLISSISPALQALQDAGLWLSNDLITLLKQTSRRNFLTAAVKDRSRVWG